ncbi:MAG: hypothetical protein AAF349_06685 [Cyanobacteria bacterium P01_A01_bin.68]
MRDRKSTKLSEYHHCPRCGEQLLEADIYMESSKNNPYDSRNCGEFTFAYTWRWCVACLFTDKNVDF